MVISDSGGGKREPTPTGAIPAVCSNYYDLGMQPGFEPGTFSHKVAILWELGETLKDGEFAGKRFTISKTYTASLNEKATLCKTLESWRGRPFTAEEKRGFDMEGIVGKPCLLNIVAKSRPDGTTTADVAAVMPLPKGVDPMKPELDRSYTPKWVAQKLAAAQGHTEAKTEDDAVF